MEVPIRSARDRFTSWGRRSLCDRRSPWNRRRSRGQCRLGVRRSPWDRCSPGGSAGLAHPTGAPHAFGASHGIRPGRAIGDGRGSANDDQHRLPRGRADGRAVAALPWQAPLEGRRQSAEYVCDGVVGARMSALGLSFGFWRGLFLDLACRGGAPPCTPRPYP